MPCFGGSASPMHVGAASGDYVLKRTHVETLREHTEREHLVLRHLADAGWSVPMPVAIEDGSTYPRIEERSLPSSSAPAHSEQTRYEVYENDCGEILLD